MGGEEEGGGGGGGVNSSASDAHIPEPTGNVIEHRAAGLRLAPLVNKQRQSVRGARGRDINPFTPKLKKYILPTF